MKGDGFQNGGALVVKAGKCLGRLCPHVDMQDRIVLTNETMLLAHLILIISICFFDIVIFIRKNVFFIQFMYIVHAQFSKYYKDK